MAISFPTKNEWKKTSSLNSSVTNSLPTKNEWKKEISTVSPEKRILSKQIDARIKNEAESQTIVDKNLYTNLRKRGADKTTVENQLTPEKTGLVNPWKPVSGLFGSISRMAQSGFDVLGGVIAAGQKARLGDSFGDKGITPSDYLDIGVEKAKKTLETPGAPGIGSSVFQAIRFGTRTAAAPVAAVFALPKGGVTPGQAFDAAIERAKQVATETDSFQVDYDKMTDDYMQAMKIGPYGDKKVSNLDVAAMTAMYIVNMTGDIGINEISSLKKGTSLLKDAFEFKKVGKIVEKLPEDMNFIKNTTRPIEVSLSDDLKIKIKPKENSIVVEGYKRRFGGTKIVPEGSIPPEVKSIIPTIERKTGSQVVARMEGDNLILTPTKVIGAPEETKLLTSPKTQNPSLGETFSVSDKADPAKVEYSKKLQKYQTAVRSFNQAPTEAKLKTILKVRQEIRDIVASQKTPEIPVKPIARTVNEGEGLLKTITPKIEKQQKVYRGDLGVVKETTRDFGNVLNVQTSQRELLHQWAASGDTKATELLNNSKSPFSKEMDNYIDAKAKDMGYDTIKYNNKDRPQVGAEYRDLTTHESFSTNQATAEAHASGRTPTRTGESKVFSKMRTQLEKEGNTLLSDKEALYRKMNLADDEIKAKTLVDSNFNEAVDIVRGTKEKTDGKKLNNIDNEVADRAIKNGDNELAVDMIRRQSYALTEAGQEIVSQRGKIMIDDPKEAIRQVIQNKIDNLGGNKRYQEILKEKTKKLSGEINKRAAKIKSAQDIIDSLTC